MHRSPRFPRFLLPTLALGPLIAIGCSDLPPAGTGGTGGSAGSGGRGGRGGAPMAGRGGTTATAGTGGSAAGSGGSSAGTGGSAAGTGGGAAGTGGGAAGTGGGAAGTGGGAAGTGGGTAGTGGGAAGTGGGAAGTGGGPAGTGGGPAGTGGGAAGAGGTGGASAGSGGTGGTGGGSVCQSTSLIFEPTIPTVYLLAERSGSAYHCLSSSSTAVVCPDLADTAWGVLKEAARGVVTMADAQARFGFSTIWGTNPAVGGMCPAMQGTLTDNVAPAMNNAAAIMTKYDSLQPPPNSTASGTKFESPTSAATQVVGQALGAITNPGEKYIVLVTTGQADYCDDGLAICGVDSTVWRIQANEAAGITTLVLGREVPVFSLPPGIMQAYANAGAGEPTVPALQAGTDMNAFYDQCSSNTGWRADLTASGKPNTRGTSLGAYSSAAGPSRAYTTSAADQAALAARIKSCSFTLAGNLHIDTTKLNLAHVKIGTTEIAQDATNGWNMPTDTQVVLNGAACTTWRTAGSGAIQFDFPCETIIFP